MSGSKQNDPSPWAGDFTPAGFVRLRRSGPETGAQVGCIFLLVAILLVVGGSILALFIINPAGKGSPWVMAVVGGAFAFIGLLLLIAGIRGLRGSSLPATELYTNGGESLATGASVRLRVRQPGPMTIESLKVTLLCERIYQRQVRRGSTSTVEDQQRLLDQVLCEVNAERLGPNEVLEREVEFAIAADAPPTGPAEPDGVIRWTIEARAEAGFMRATYHPFGITVCRAG